MIYTCASNGNYDNLPFNESIVNDIKDAYETALTVGLQDPETAHSAPLQDSKGPNDDLAKALERIKELENIVKDLPPRPNNEAQELHETKEKIGNLENEVSSLGKELAALTTTINVLTPHSLQPISRPKRRNQTPRSDPPRTAGMDQFVGLANNEYSLTQLEQTDEDRQAGNLNGSRPTGTGSPQKCTGDDSLELPPSTRPRESDDEL